MEGSAFEACLFVFVQHRKMRRDLRFERKTLQQPFAEAVNGMDLEAAFGFERARKQPPRQAQSLGVGRLSRKFNQSFS